MNPLKWAALAIVIFMATAIAKAQQKFPMRAGEWTATMADPTPNQPPLVMLYCLNDELWTKALTQNPSCAITQLSVFSTGASYNLNCSSKSYEMKGKVDMVFDGKMHMTANGSIDIAMNGKTTHSISQTDFRWKGPVCDPNADMNLRVHHAPPQ